MCPPCAGEEADNELASYIKIIMECKMKLKMKNLFNEHFSSKDCSSGKA